MKATIAFFLVAGLIIKVSAIGTQADFILQDDRWVAPASAKAIENPNKGDKSSIKRGKGLYKSYCMVCHGETGTGDGPGSKALETKPANHTSAEVQKQTDGEIFWKITEGRGSMVGWKNVLKEQDRWDLVNFVRTLAK